MPSASKSNRRKSKKFKFVPKAKRPQQVKQPSRNWLELSSDVMANILHRIGVHDILENAQKVCTAWRKICKDPAMWRVIYMDLWHIHLEDIDKVRALCRHAVDRSQGQLIDITMVGFCDDELLLYVADRSSQLRRLKIALCYGDMYRSWTEALKKFSFADKRIDDIGIIWTDALKKFPLLEELSFYKTEISTEAIEIVGHYCPMLKTLKVNQEAWDAFADEYYSRDRNDIAIAIGENLHELEHLEIVGDIMSNIGLQTILDGCRHLKSLDLRRCLGIDLKGGLGERCSELIKCLKLPNDSVEGFPYIYKRCGPRLYGFPANFDSLKDEMPTFMEMFG